MKINGKNLAKFLKVDAKDYRKLYPNRKRLGYCAYKELLGDAKHCQGMITVMEALDKKMEYELPSSAHTISAYKKYKSGEVWLDETLRIAYLYIGKDAVDKDIVLNLGGETSETGKVIIGKINERYGKDIFFDKRVFPKD